MLKGLVEGTKGGGELKNFVFVAGFTEARMTTTHQAWILGVKVVDPEFTRGWQSLPQNGVVRDFHPEKPVI